MAIFNGTDVALSVGGTVVAQATEVSISLNQETIDVTTKDSSGMRELLPGLKSGSCSVSGLQDYSDAAGVEKLTSTFDTGAAVAIIWDSTSGETFSASGILTSLELAGGTEDAPTYSASFELTGTITKADT